MCNCLNCGKEVKNKYCNVSCQNEYRYKTGLFNNPEIIEKRNSTRYGELKKYNVKCSNCDKNIIIEEREKSFPKKQKYFCSKECSNKRTNRIENERKPRSEETKKKISESNKGKIISSEAKEKLKIKGKKRLEDNRENGVLTPFDKEWWTDERKKEQSLKMKKIVQDNPESYSSKNVCGRSKNYKYNGFILNGKWELEFAKYLNFYNLKWYKVSKSFDYFWEGEIHQYFPDFYIEEYDLYIEIKGYKTEKDEYKWCYFTNNLNVLFKNDIDEIKKINIKNNISTENDKYYKKIKKSKIVGLSDEQKNSMINNRKIERPSYNQLIKDISDLGYLATGRKYSVSDNAIRKWKKWYEKYENK